MRKLLLMLAVAAAVPAPAFAQANTAIAPETDDYLQYSAGVVKLTELKRQGDATVKLFGTAGGDPAMNGLYTYIAFFESVADGWRIFRIGDFIDYKVLAETEGSVTLELRESTMNDATGDIGARTRRVRVSWTMGADGAPPAQLTVTPAR